MVCQNAFNIKYMSEVLGAYSTPKSKVVKLPLEIDTKSSSDAKFLRDIERSPHSSPVTLSITSQGGMANGKKYFSPATTKSGMYRSLQEWKTNDWTREGDSTQRWTGNFHLMCSKDNVHYPKYLREYFDTPRVYDVNGSRR